MTNLSVCQFKIVHQNIRSVRKNFDLLLAELEATSLDPDIIVLSEVWIMSNETCLYDIPHYILYANCNDGYRAGGVIIYVKQNIKVLNCHNVQFNTADVIKIILMSMIRIFIYLPSTDCICFQKKCLLTNLVTI